MFVNIIFLLSIHFINFNESFLHNALISLFRMYVTHIHLNFNIQIELRILKMKTTIMMRSKE